MPITLNGKIEYFDCPISIFELLNKKGLKPQRVVVEVNYEIIDRKNWGDFLLNENDQVEILQFVGGG